VTVVEKTIEKQSRYVVKKKNRNFCYFPETVRKRKD
jgi:hypothetical protein